MEATIRVPTVQFGYIEIKKEVLDLEHAVILHNTLIAEYESRKADVQKLKDDNF